jgi:hypothetical protein
VEPVSNIYPEFRADGCVVLSEQEPLPCIAVKKGFIGLDYFQVRECNDDLWRVALTRSMNSVKLFTASTYAAAEAKARTFLNAMPDKGEAV